MKYTTTNFLPLSVFCPQKLQIKQMRFFRSRMVRVITQETFDLVVKENMEEFDMERAEAVRDAREQFEQQGVSLVNIVVSEQGSQVCQHSKLDIFPCLSP